MRALSNGEASRLIAAGTRDEALIILALRTGMRKGEGAGRRAALGGPPHARLHDQTGLAFPNRRGKVRRRDSVARSLRALLVEAGLPPDAVRFHDLRHTAGTLAVRQGMLIHVVSKMLGRKDPAMTLRRYAHVLGDMREDAARAMDDLF